jgi:hypothetical protein
MTFQGDPPVYFPFLRPNLDFGISAETAEPKPVELR